MHDATIYTLRALVAEYGLDSGKVIVDIGSKGDTGDYRALFGSSTYIGVDKSGGSNVNVVFGSGGWNSLVGTVDVFISGRNFEQVANITTLLSQLYSAMKDGAMIIIMAPTTWFRHIVDDRKTIPVATTRTYLENAGFTILHYEDGVGGKFHDSCVVARKG